MKVKTGRLWLAIPEQQGVKTHAARIVFKRDPLIDAVIYFRIAGPQRDRQEAIDVLRQPAVMARIRCGDHQQRRGDQRFASGVTPMNS